MEGRDPGPMGRGWDCSVSPTPFCAAAVRSTEHAFQGKWRRSCGMGRQTLWERRAWRMVIFAARKMAKGTGPIKNNTMFRN